MQIRSRDLSVRTVSAAMALIAALLWTAAAAANDVYTIANYPVEATARNAVTAKKLAIQQGRRDAFRSLIKRIVPVTAYKRIGPLDQIDPRPLTRSVAVRSERSSTTRYIAALDFTFSQAAVQEQLERAGIAFVDTPAPATIAVLIYGSSAAGIGAIGAVAGQQMWRSVWDDLDLKNSVTPLELRRASRKLQAATLQGIAQGDPAALSQLTKHYGRPRVIVAVAEPDLARKRLNVILAGRDASGIFVLKRKYRLDTDDFAYTLEFAAVVSQGIIEGRWKATQTAATGDQAADKTAKDVEIWVEFTSLAQWRRIQETLRQLPGVEGLETGGLSTNGASVRLSYPGGGEKLRNTLAQHGRSLEPYQDIWVLR